jgi:hypothetical protein
MDAFWHPSLIGGKLLDRISPYRRQNDSTIVLICQIAERYFYVYVVNGRGMLNGGEVLPGEYDINNFSSRHRHIFDVTKALDS